MDRMKYTPEKVSSSMMNTPRAMSAKIIRVVCWSARSRETMYRMEPNRLPLSSRTTRVMAITFSPVFNFPIHLPESPWLCKASW